MAESGEPARWRVLAFQPVAFDIDVAQPLSLMLDASLPRAWVVPRESDRAKQYEGSGCTVAVEFESDESDPLVLFRHGLGLADDLFAALTLATQIPFGNCRPVQLLEITPGIESALFLFLLPISIGRADKTITAEHFHVARGVFAHWRALSDGARLRRAFRRYREALVQSDELEAFQTAYFGLEALEKPLALEVGLTPGTEEVPGRCESCNAEYVRKRTALVGVSKFVKGGSHGGETAEGIKDWKKISRIRADLVHGLEDPEKLRARALDALPVVLHALHNATAHLAHQHRLETGEYAYASQPMQCIVVGHAPSNAISRLREWEPLVEHGDLRWVSHERFGLVPEYTIRARAKVGATVYWLAKPFSLATGDDLAEGSIESGRRERDDDHTPPRGEGDGGG